jgi:hypothetical protein
VSEPEKSNLARLIADNVEKMLDFADQQEDFVLGAKLAEVQAILAERYLPSK